MWFKNLKIYRITKDIDLCQTHLNERLMDSKFKPCGNLDFSKCGWLEPIQHSSDVYAYESANNTLLCLRLQEKILPAAAINEALEQKIKDLESKLNRKLYRKETRELKDEVIHSLLPRALTKSTLIHGYVSLQDNYIIINTSSDNKAELFLDTLRASLGELPVVPILLNKHVGEVMTLWLKTKSPMKFDYNSDCELSSKRDSKNLVHYKNQELESEEVQKNLTVGKEVKSMALIWNEAISFKLCNDFTIKSVKFMDEIIEQAADQSGAEDEITQLDNDFIIMSLQINNLLKDLTLEFGGIKNA